MLGRDWQIGRILGIPIKVHSSWFLVFLFVTWTLAAGYLPTALPGLSSARYWGMGSVAALLLFLSVLLHELGHSYVALQYRIPISQITLFIFGGVAQMRKEPPGPRAEFLIAIAGPIVSFLLGGLCLSVVTVGESLSVARQPQGLLVLGSLLGAINIQLGLFNLIPGLPLDGGRVLRAGLWAWTKNFYRATSQAALAGLVIAVLIGLAGGALLVGAMVGALPSSVAGNGGWVILIGAFLFAAARNSRKQAALRVALDQVSVKDLMTRTVNTLSPDMTIEQAVNQYFVQYGDDAFPVTEQGHPVGLVTVREVQALPTAVWGRRQIRDVMRPWSARCEVQAACPVSQVLERMLQEDHYFLAVVEDGRLAGFITRPAIARFMQLRGTPGMRGEARCDQ
ncbi:MAG: site-2 protease family protein [Nitrospiraceae bacterium]